MSIDVNLQKEIFDLFESTQSSNQLKRQDFLAFREEVVKKVNQIFDTYGWPAQDTIGEEGSKKLQNAVLFTLNSKLNQKAYDLIKIQVAVGKASPDIMRMFEYGTIGTFDLA